MNRAFEGFAPGRVWSLKNMLELNAHSFLIAANELRTLISTIDTIPHENKGVVVSPEHRDNIFLPHASRLIEMLDSTGARMAIASANRLTERMRATNSQMTYAQVGSALNDIESRFADHLNDIKLFVIHQHEALLMEPVNVQFAALGEVADGFPAAFPNASFEIEEALKCIALGRHTASVFHVMRATELGIKAMAKVLSIPDPVRGTDRNWGNMLKLISSKMEERWPKSGRISGSQGAQFESLYASLDAMKNPWRNETMHVEANYAAHEALHIARCASYFMIQLMKHCN